MSDWAVYKKPETFLKFIQDDMTELCAYKYKPTTYRMILVRNMTQFLQIGRLWDADSKFEIFNWQF